MKRNLGLFYGTALLISAAVSNLAVSSYDSSYVTYRVQRVHTIKRILESEQSLRNNFSTSNLEEIKKLRAEHKSLISQQQTRLELSNYYNSRSRVQKMNQANGLLLMSSIMFLGFGLVQKLKPNLFENLES